MHAGADAVTADGVSRTALVICDGHARLHINHVGALQAFFVASSSRALRSDEAALEFYRWIGEALQQRRMHILHERIFGSTSVQHEVLQARKTALDSLGIDSNGPVTYIEGRPVCGEGLAGVVIRAAAAAPSDREPWLIYDGQKPCGRGWRQDGATHFVIQALQSGGTAASDKIGKARQVDALLDKAKMLLAEQGASYSDVARTWFYLRDIVDWYGEFNRVRNAKYEQFGIMPTSARRGIMPSGCQTRLMLPASTAIQGKNAQDAPAVLDLLAIVPPPGQDPPFRQLSSAGQMDAFRYGSAFSRGVLIGGSGSSHIALSGTAAIGEKGESLFVGDPAGQMACTLDKAGVLTASHGAALSNIAAAVCYAKHPEHAELFWQEAAKRGLEDLPVVCMQADICREELLFEMEAVVAIDG